MHEYRYLLIRYIPDAERMEPTNVGLILQGAGRIDVRISPHAAKRKEIDTAVFRQWRQFFLDELRGDPTPLFQPEKNSPQFLTYLERLCEGAVILSRPLAFATIPGRSFEDVLDSLYLRLVAPAEETSTAAATRPTGRFRQIAQTRDFLRRGLKRHAHVVVNDTPLWMAYRQVCNGRRIAIDKVEVNREIGATANEIERLPYILERLPTFLQASSQGGPGRYYLLADVLKQPFTDQAEAAFQAMQRELEQVVERVQEKGGGVIRTVPEAEKLADELDQVLPPPLAAAVQD